MAKRFRFSISGPPFGFIVQQLMDDDDFKKDARQLLGIEQERFEALADALVANDSFLDRDAVRSLAASHLGEAAEASQISHAIWRFAEILRDADQALDKAFAILREAINEQLEDFSKEEKEELLTRLQRLCVNPLGFNRQHKAERLAEATSKELENLQIICDIRPVFNEDRSEIEGAIPATLLQISFDDIGTSSSLDIRLTESQLRDLEDKVGSARKKLRVIKDFLVAKSVAMPMTSATLTDTNDK